MKELCRDLYTGFTDQHPDLGMVSRVSRIYRDARRLFGRGPYKDHLWLTISQPAERWACQPVFWFELGPAEHSFGLGYWMAQALTMAKFRARMDREPKVMEKLARAVNKQDTFRLRGETFKRPPINRAFPSAASGPTMTFSGPPTCRGIFWRSGKSCSRCFATSPLWTETRTQGRIK